MSAYPKINEVYNSSFDYNPPVRVCVQVNMEEQLRMSAVGFKRNDVAEVRKGLSIPNGFLSREWNIIWDADSWTV